MSQMAGPSELVHHEVRLDCLVLQFDLSDLGCVQVVSAGVPEPPGIVGLLFEFDNSRIKRDIANNRRQLDHAS